jgi:hypothetical protein
LSQEDEQIRELTTAILHLGRALIAVRGTVMEIMEDPALSKERVEAANKPLFESFDSVKEFLEIIKSLNRQQGHSDG